MTVVTALALALGALAVIHAGPFTSSPATTATPPAAIGATVPTVVADAAGTATDIRGTWDMLLVFEAMLSPQRLVVTAEDRSTGVFSGTVQTLVGVAAITGRVSGDTVSFTISLGNGTETGTASVTTDGSGDHLNGKFTSPDGVTGSITATRRPG